MGAKMIFCRLIDILIAAILVMVLLFGALLQDAAGGLG